MRSVISDDDPFLWLEEIEGEAALAWVARQNARTLAALESDPRFDRL
jgi:prolyl oligopeptidase